MTKRLTAKVGEYQKDGQTKGRYVDVGALLSNANGEYILLNPSVSLSGILAMQNAMSQQPRTNVMISIFDSDNQQQQAPQQQAQPQQQQQQQAPQQQVQGGGGAQGFDDDVPFAQYERNSII